MHSWLLLRRRVLDHIVELQTRLPDAMSRGDSVAAFGMARDLEGATMAIGLEDAARLASGLVPLLALPTVRPDEASRLLARVRHAVAKAAKPTRDLPALGARVLVVDDDEITLQVLQHILEQAGCDVALAGNLRDARQALRNKPLQPFQAVILDLHLRDGRGTTFLRELRSDPTMHLLPVVVLTGDADQAALRGAYAAGADDFLVKPVRADDLVLRLGLLIRQTRLQAVAVAA